MTARVVFWCSAAWVVYAYVGYACVLRLLAVWRARPVRAADITPPVTFVITAHNEEDGLEDKIQNTLQQDYTGPLEIIVASDCSTDRTDHIARAFAPRVRLVRSVERRGKEAAQALAVQASTGHVMVFSDVATSLDADGVSAIVRNFADPTVGCVSSVDRFVEADGRPSGEGAYVRYEMWLRSLESRVYSLVGLSGSFFAARREFCDDWATDCQSDFATLLRVIGRGQRGVIDPHSVGYYRNIVDDRREFSRKVRTVVRGLHVLARHRRMLNPLRHGMFAWQLASHKLARWLVPFAMVAAFVSNFLIVRESDVYAGLWLAQCGFYAAAAIGWWTRQGWLRVPTYLLVANVAVLVAWIRFARGDRIAVWNPSQRVAKLP
jgi:glycosyltransferase involved in cell wall biosynthesis